MALRKLFGSFNNIMSVLGSARDEMLAVHLVKTYCLPVLLYNNNNNDRLTAFDPGQPG